MKTRFFTALILCIAMMACKGLKSGSENGRTADSVSYHTSIRPVIDNYCTTCHAGKSPAAGIDLSSYAEVLQQSKDGDLLKRINDKQNPMPQGGLMPTATRKIFRQWAELGYPEHGSAVESENTEDYVFQAPTIDAVDLDKSGFEFFDLMQGHWVGPLNIMGQKYPWFAFDYRAISESHVHGIFEGGSLGNLFTSFFIADYKGTKTIMARNGGLLNGIYRTSYFVLDEVELSERRKYFRLVDAYGGKDIMWMDLEFKDKRLLFKSYTSRFGMTGYPKLHMHFKAKKMDEGLANEASKTLGYPKNHIAFSFTEGMPTPSWSKEYGTVTSASYIYQDSTNSGNLTALAKLANDPVSIDDMPHVARLKVDLETEQNKNHKSIIYLSRLPLTNENGKLTMEHGFVKEEVYNTVLSFPELVPEENSFTFTYLHPGSYYVTLVLDVNKDGYASKGDLTARSIKVEVSPKSFKTIELGKILVGN